MKFARIVLAGTLVLAIIAALTALLGSIRQTRIQPEAPEKPPSSAAAFAQTYLDVDAGKPLQEKRSCNSCHEVKDELAPREWDFLSARWKLTATEWAAELQLNARCGSCHLTPDPRTLPWQSWNEAVNGMSQIMQQKGVPQLSRDERRDLVHYYYAFSPGRMPPLEADPDPKSSPVQFAASVFGNGLNTNFVDRPFIGHVQVTDLDQDGRPDALVCDSDNSSLNWIRQTQGEHGESIWHEEPLAKLPSPARTDIFTNRATGRPDIVVACQERITPTDELTGSVVLLRNEGQTERATAHGRFTPVTILTNISRVASVEPGDFNGDGEVDFVVAAFGHINEGEIGWLEQRGGNFSYHQILKRPGAIRVVPVDINGDGFLDFIALFGQEHERICAFLNDGKASFSESILFEAATPTFGSAGIELVDLDQDRDIDILYTNGDNMDLRSRIPRPYHGVQWLENRGNLNFVFHDILRFYGAYCAVPADINQDGHLDIVVTSVFNDWQDPTRASLLWLQNDGRQQFTAHAIARQPIQLISAAVADFNHDGRLDIIASGMHIFPPLDRRGRVTLWTNNGSQGSR